MYMVFVKKAKKAHKNKTAQLLTSSIGIFGLFVIAGSVMASQKIGFSNQLSSMPGPEISIHSDVASAQSMIKTEESPAGITDSASVSKKPTTPSEDPVAVATEPQDNSLTEDVTVQKTNQPVQSSETKPVPVVSSNQSLTFINQVRASDGKAPLTLNDVLTKWATTHALAMASKCDSFHQDITRFLGASAGSFTIKSIAENVGYATTLDQALAGLEASPGHYINMTGDYTHLGIGVVTATSGNCAGYIFTTQIFAG